MSGLPERIKQRLPAPFVRNFRLKALAFGLALVCWTVVVYASDPPGTRTFQVDVPTASLPNQYVLSPPPGQISIRVRGTRGNLDSFSSADLRFSAAFDRVQDVGTQQVAVSIASTDPAVELDSAPSSITVTVDKNDHKEIPVTVEISAPAPDGYTYKESDITLTPTVVSVYGPSKRLADLHASAPVSLNNIKTTYVSNPKVFIYQGTNPSNRISDLLVTPTSVTVTVPVASNTVSRASAVVPNITGTPGFGRIVSSITVSPPFVVLNGPQDVLAGLNSVTTDPIRLNGLFNTVKQTVNVVVQGTAVSIDPGKVTVTITITFIPTTPTPQPSPSPTATAAPTAPPTAGPTPTPTPAPTPSPTP